MSRTTKLTADLTAKIMYLYSKGRTDKQVAEMVGVSERSLNYWKKNNIVFLQSLKEAKALADDMVEASLYNRAIGYTHPEEKIFVYEGCEVRVDTFKHYPPDPVSAIFWLKNRRPADWRENNIQPPAPGGSIVETTIKKKTYLEFCTTAGYPPPYEKQIEMRAFSIDEKVPRLLLGARGYGKSDYCVVLGLAYEIYEAWFERWAEQPTTLIITKSKERNASMLKEIASACIANGVVFEKQNSNSLRVAGLIGTNHTVSAVTIKTVTLRGRHPKRVVMDDPVTEDDVSEATRLHVERVYNEVNKLCPNILIIGQPAHQFDLYAKLRPLLKLLEVPHGTIPELDHDLDAQRLAGVSEASIQASYFLKILTEGTTPFDKIKYIDKFPGADTSVAFIDPSFEGGDYTAITIAQGYMQGIAIVGFTFKKAWNHCLDEIVPLLAKFKVRRLAFETNSLGDQPIIMLRELLGQHVGVVGIKSNGNKHSRIMNAGAYAHLIHMSKQSDKIYQDQVVKYEYKAKHDDAPDSLASVLTWIGLIRGKI